MSDDPDFEEMMLYAFEALDDADKRQEEDEDFGNEHLYYYIVEYRDDPPPFPKSSIIAGPILGYTKALNQSKEAGDVMLCLASEIEGMSNDSN